VGEAKSVSRLSSGAGTCCARASGTSRIARISVASSASGARNLGGAVGASGERGRVRCGTTVGFGGAVRKASAGGATRDAWSVRHNGDGPKRRVPRRSPAGNNAKSRHTMQVR